jgi:hypothetical protein
MNADIAAATNADAAIPAYFHIAAASRVGTTGSGGSPYTSGSSIIHRLLVGTATPRRCVD